MSATAPHKPPDEGPRDDSGPWELEVFFDGECPLCRREIGWLKRRDRAGKIRFTDISEPGFDFSAIGIEQSQLMAELHARLRSGHWLRGVEAFRQMYTRVGWRIPVAISRWPGIAQMLEVGYWAFARNRLRLTGRCTSACPVPNAARNPP